MNQHDASQTGGVESANEAHTAEFASRPFTFERLGRRWRQIGGGSLALSLAIHAAAILVLASIVILVQPPEHEIDFIRGAGGGGKKAADQPIQKTVAAKRLASLSRSQPQSVIAAHSPDAEVFINRKPAEAIDVGSSLDLGDPAASLLREIGKGGSGPGSRNWSIGDGPFDLPVTRLPAVMIGRCSAAKRLENLHANGGTPECERAVSKALAWLKDKQNADGSWGRSHTGAMTGLALLCYLGRCETPDSPFFGDNVMRGILSLIELSKKNEHGVFSLHPPHHAASYEHGIATYALGEMFTLARLGTKELPGLRDAFEKGVRIIIEHQLPDGGWGYGPDFCYRKEGAGDLSVTGWQFQALKAAKHSGLKIAGLDAAVKKAVAYLEGNQTKDGGFGGTSREQGYNQWNLTGVGALGLQTLSTTNRAEVSRGIRFLRELITAEPLDWNTNANLYCWYYNTQAFFQKGGDDWRMFNQQFMPQLLANQAADGGWSSERANSPAASSSAAGADRDIYRTALCALMLEVYYRYLKVADREERSVFE